MSLVSYLGCNKELSFDEDDSENPVLIGEFFSEHVDRENIKAKFSTPYVYEIQSNKHDTIWVDFYSYAPNKKMYQETLEELQVYLDELLSQGEYAELYVCWLGDEKEETRLTQEIFIDSDDFFKLELPENSFTRFRKK